MSEYNLAKIAISSSADNFLSKALERVNTGFDGGRVTKIDLATWMITQASESMDNSTIDEIRRAHFNQAAYLEALVKKMKSSSRDSLDAEELAALQDMLGQPGTKKRTRTARLTENTEAESHQSN